MSYFLNKIILNFYIFDFVRANMNANQKREIEKYLILAKGKTGAAANMVIDQVLSAKEIFVFGEFLAMPNIQGVSWIDLKSIMNLKALTISSFFVSQLGADSKHLNTLNLFAYDTVTEYNANKAKYLDLKAVQL